MSRIGCDLSRWQGDIPTTGLEYLDFAYVQATYGSQIFNAYAIQQVAALKSQGVRVGYYHYVTNDPLIEQVMNFQLMARSLGNSTLPLALDIEEPDPAGWLDLSNMLMSFARAIEAWPEEAMSHQKAMIYCNLSYAASMDASGFPWGRYVWLADPNPGAPHRPCAILQSAPRIVASFPAAVDPDVFLGSDADWQQFIGATGAWQPGPGSPSGPPPVAPTPPPAPVPPHPPKPAPQEADMAVTQPVLYRNGQTDFFQVAAGAIWHKWVGVEGSANESLGQVCSLPATTFVGQPMVSVINGTCIVTVEDSEGKAHWFSQASSGGWTHREMP